MNEEQHQQLASMALTLKAIEDELGTMAGQFLVEVGIPAARQNARVRAERLLEDAEKAHSLWVRLHLHHKDWKVPTRPKEVTP